MRSNLKIFAITLGVLSLIASSFSLPAQASTPGWDAGNIMTDSVMSKKNSLSQSEITSFLKSKNSCNKSVASAGGRVIGESSSQAYWKADKSVKYQISGGKKGTTKGTFRCIAKATFDGSSASYIIYDAARDYDINPQVLIVLLQKEASLITDQWPNSKQYRTAAGFGCPDTGPGNTANCDKNYYGFKNQIRLAAKLFRGVLDGGWSNYPVGNNYIQYNPSASCGGKTVNVKNRATSALYRYTPYQPNKKTLDAAYGVTVECGAYGNKNFYLLFRSWFGSTRTGAPAVYYSKLERPRWMRLKSDTAKRSLPSTSAESNSMDEGTELFFSTKTTINNIVYLRSEYDTEEKKNKGVPISALEEIDPSFVELETPRWLQLKESRAKMNAVDRKAVGSKLAEGKHVYFDEKTKVGGDWYLRDKNDNGDSVIPLSKVSPVSTKYSPLNVPRPLRATKNTKTLNPITANQLSNLSSGSSRNFNSKIFVGGKWYVRTNTDTANKTLSGVPLDDLESAPNSFSFSNMAKARWMEVSSAKTTKKHLVSGENYGSNFSQGKDIYFKTKTTLNGVTYLRSTADTEASKPVAIRLDSLKNIRIKYVSLDEPRVMQLKKSLRKTHAETAKTTGSLLSKNLKIRFKTKTQIGGKWYLRSEYDTSRKTHHVIPLSQLKDI